jgi:hypothetical protein
MAIIARRDFITLLGGAAFTRPLAASAQQPTLPVVGFIRGGSADASVRYVTTFRKGLSDYIGPLASGTRLSHFGLRRSRFHQWMSAFGGKPDIAV